MAHRSPVTPLRTHPLEPDSGDSARITWARELWSEQDELIAPRNRMIEENLRMLAGEQWSVWVRKLDQFVSVDDLLDDSERLWRQKPVMNLLKPWFMLTHSRMTENPPIVGFLPSTADEVDALAAEVWDMVHKTLWRALDMERVHADCMAWLIPGGRSHFKTLVDPDNDDPGLQVDVLAAPEVRAEWGPRPWHRKRWHFQVSYLTPEEVFDFYGKTIEPTTSRKELGGDLHALLYSSGYYQAASRNSLLAGGERRDDEELIEVGELWMAPTAKVPGMERIVHDDGTVESPGGRLLIFAGDEVLRDGPRPVDVAYTSPIRCHDYVNLPGRPSGSTPQEALNPIQRQINRLLGQIQEHTNLVCNPKPVIHQSVQMEDWDNTHDPVVANWAVGVTNPIYYLQAPPLGKDVYTALEFLMQQFDTIGSLRGAEGRRPESGISGESVKELRSNADRPVNATMVRAVQEYARWAEDLIAYIRVLWPEGRVLEYAGEDNMVETITVAPELYRGKVDVFADTESMIPQGREAREQNAQVLFAGGFFGPPDTQKARSRFLDYARMPATGRDIEPGHQHRRMARRAMALVLRGTPAEDVPLYRWHDFAIWIDEIEEHLASPEFLRHEPPVRVQLTILHELVSQALRVQMQQQIAEEVQTQGAAMMAAEAAANSVQPAPKEETA